MPGEEILKYPTFSSGGFFVFLLLLAVALIGYLWLRSRTRNKLRGDLLWNRLLAYGRKRGLDRKELRFLLHFYQSLSGPERERLMNNRPFFRDRMRTYLARRSEVTARGRVRVYQKLFPEIDYRLEIMDASDLQPGEFCTLGTRKRAALARVVESDSETVKLNLIDPVGGNDFPEGGSGLIFAYRPLLGEFALNGKVYERYGNTLVFRYGGRVQAHYEMHLMLEREIQIRLEPARKDPAREAGVGAHSPDQGAGGTVAAGSSPATIDQLIDEQAQVDRESELDPGLAPVEEETPYVVGTTEKISDRALTLRLAEGTDTEKLRRTIKRIELWRVNFLLEGSYELNCVGSLYPGRTRGLFLFRFRDMPEQEHRNLFRFIQKAGGVRERI